ncbi:hypothetical protein Pmani_012592, partial [Petrolisthes manimaculis]
VCVERGWRVWETGTEGEELVVGGGGGGGVTPSWHLWWRQCFPPAVFKKLKPHQVLNHIPRAGGLCRKDSLARALHKMKHVFGSAFDFMFGTEKYNLDCLDNVYSHLTNTSLNRLAPGYSLEKDSVGAGCKWRVGELRRHLAGCGRGDWVLWQRVWVMVVLTLLTQVGLVPHHHNCFQLYGFDILVDAGLRPWLLEVNRSPSLSHDCHVDRVVKKPLLHHLFDLVGPPRVPEPPLGRPLRPPVLFLLARRPRRHLCAALRLLGGRGGGGGGGGGGTGGCQGSGCRGECQGRTRYQKHTNTTILPSTTANRHVTRQLSISSYDSSTSSTASSNGRRRVGWGVGGRGMEAGKLGWGRTGRNSIEGSGSSGSSGGGSSSVGRRRSQRNSDGGGRLSWGSGGSSSSSSSSSGGSSGSGTGGGGGGGGRRGGGRWPARCGGWVRTFPFNAATLHASRDPSFLKTQVSELLRYQRACDRAARDNTTNATQATLDAAVRKLLWRDTVIWAPAYPP